MKAWSCGWLILASLGISCLAGRCLAQPQFPDDKKELIEQLPVPQALNLEALFKKIDQQKLEAAWAALKKHGITPENINDLLAHPDFKEAADRIEGWISSLLSILSQSNAAE